MTKLLVPSYETVLGKHHRWSGWPGAICIDCGCAEPLEASLADLRPEDDVEMAYKNITVTECPVEKVIKG